MGTDIDMYVERLVDGRWELVPPPEPPIEVPRGGLWWGPGFHADGCLHSWQPTEVCDEACERCHGTNRNMQWFEIRHYPLFGALAGVRRYGSDRPAISIEPRGLPSDVSAWVATLLEEERSRSWVSLEELIRFDWHTVPTPAEDPDESPDLDWWGTWLDCVNDYMLPVLASVHGARFETELSVLLDAMEVRSDPSVRQRLRWARPTDDARITAMQEAILHLACYVRIVFGFN